jgi:hypothetical protein
MKYVNKNTTLFILKIKVKFPCYAMQAQRGRIGIAPTFS